MAVACYDNDVDDITAPYTYCNSLLLVIIVFVLGNKRSRV